MMSLVFLMSQPTKNTTFVFVLTSSAMVWVWAISSFVFRLPLCCLMRDVLASVCAEVSSMTGALVITKKQ